MKWWFTVPEKWEARQPLGRDKRLSKFQSDLVDVVDVLDQKTEIAVQRATVSLNITLLLLALFIVVNGPEALDVIKEWLK